MRHRSGLMLSRRGMIGVTAAVGLAGAAAAQGALLTRRIPRSGEVLPVIGLGTAIGWGTRDPAQSEARTGVIRALTAAGGTLIDTAPSYGESEALIGHIVASANARRGVFLATKLENFDRRAGPAQLQASLRRLRADSVDLMQLHNVSDARQDLAMPREWKARGLCRYIGVTTTNHADFAAVETLLRREKPDFVELDYSIDDREATKRLLPAAADLGVAVLVAQPFGSGDLFRAIRQRPLPPWAADFGAATWGQFFLKYLLGDPAVTALIPGTSNPAHMEDNLAAGRGRVPDAAERRKMVEFFAAA